MKSSGTSNIPEVQIFFFLERTALQKLLTFLANSGSVFVHNTSDNVKSHQPVVSFNWSQI